MLGTGATFSGGASGTYTDFNTTYSAFEYSNNANSITSRGTGFQIIASGRVYANAIEEITLDHIYPLTLNRAGANRNFGTLVFESNNSAIVHFKFWEFR